MSQFVAAFFVIHDRAGYERYVELATPIFMREGVKILGNDNEAKAISPGTKVDKAVLLEFRDETHMKDFFSAPDYMEAAKHRDAASTLTAIRFKRFTA